MRNKSQDEQNLSQHFCSFLNNQAGARSNPTRLHEYLVNKKAIGSVIGPFEANPLVSQAKFSPLDAIPKKDS